MIKHFFSSVSELNPDDFNVPKTGFGPDSIAGIFQIVFAIAAGITIIVLMLAGLKYILSRGEPAEVAKAKNTIIYAAIGLVVTASAFGIVSFVVNRV